MDIPVSVLAVCYTLVKAAKNHYVEKGHLVIEVNESEISLEIKMAVLDIEVNSVEVGGHIVVVVIEDVAKAGTEVVNQNIDITVKGLLKTVVIVNVNHINSGLNYYEGLKALKGLKGLDDGVGAHELVQILVTNNNVDIMVKDVIIVTLKDRICVVQICI